MNQQLRTRFSWRALTSLCVAVSFLAMVISGMALFFAPSTRIAHEINWQMCGLAKSSWQDLHNVFSTLFLIAALIHTVFNWRPLMNYLKMRAAECRAIRWEWLVALVLGVLVWMGTRSELPPFSVLLDWREKFHGGHCWQSEASSDHSPARGQGGFGQKTLAEYCAEQGLNLDAALARLQAGGIKARGADTFRQLADKNGYDRPSEIIRLLQQP